MGQSRTVTVIVPVYNRERSIRRAIDSVRQQTFADWELIVVDDGSTDQSPAMVGAYQDERIRLMRTAKNGGAGAARNVGIQHSSSPFIALLDSDDVFHPEFLERSLSAWQGADETTGFSYTAVGDVEKIVVGASPVAQNVWIMPEWCKSLKHPYMGQLQVGTAAGIVIHKKVFDAIGLFDERLRAAEDTDWFIRASEFFKGLPIPQVLIFKDHDSSDRLTSNYCRNLEAYEIIVEKNKQEIDASAFLTRRWHYKVMWLAFYCGDRKSAAKHYNILKEKKMADRSIRLMFGAGRVLPRNAFIRLHKKMAGLRERQKEI
jgi:glycosyltransferase involved in cell wall biosynthesis